MNTSFRKVSFRCVCADEFSAFEEVNKLFCNHSVDSAISKFVYLRIVHWIYRLFEMVHWAKIPDRYPGCLVNFCSLIFCEFMRTLSVQIFTSRKIQEFQNSDKKCEFCEYKLAQIDTFVLHFHKQFFCISYEYKPTRIVLRILSENLQKSRNFSCSLKFVRPK